MFSPGDIVLFHSEEAAKAKYHLCVNQNGSFLFINSPKAKSYPADFSVPSTEIDCLEATSEGYSIVSCTHLTVVDDAVLRRLRAKKIGDMPNRVLLRLIAFVEKTPVLSTEEKESIISGLADWA